MKLSNANIVRAEVIGNLLQFIANSGEDCALIASNSFNFPVVCNGEEGWVEVVVKIPKEEGDEGYGKREEYSLKCAESERKARERAEAKAKKIAKDKARREAKAQAKAGE